MTTRFYVALWLLLCLALVLVTTRSAEESPVLTQPAPFLMAEDGWADSVWRRMDDQVKIGEMFMLISDYEDSSNQDLTALLASYDLGGILFQNYPVAEQVRLTDSLQRTRSHPLMIGMNLASSSSDLIQIPTDMSLAAIHDDSLLHEVGKHLATQAQHIGVQLLLMPTMETAFEVDDRGDYINNLRILNKGLQEEEVLLCPANLSPYFPFERDSVRLQAQLEPYHQLSKAGLAAMQLDVDVTDRIHLNSNKQQIIQHYLAAQIDYEGLILGKVENELGDVEDQVRKMLKAGTDLILVEPAHLAEAVATARDLKRRQFFSESALRSHAHKLLLAKSWTGIHRSYRRTDTILPKIDMAASQWDNRRLAQANLTLVRNTHQQIPIANLREKATHLLVIGEDMPELLSRMRSYGPVSTSQILAEPDQGLKALKPDILQEFTPVVIALNGVEPSIENDPDFFASLEVISKRTEVILINFGELESLRVFEQMPSLMQSYSPSALNQNLIAQVLLGGLQPKGRLPIQLSETLEYGMGDRFPVSRLAHSQPEAVGINSEALFRIDSIVQEGIQSYAMPGCQILVAKQGQVIYNRSFGHHTYARKRRVHPTDLYDLASVTKVAATTVASMKMQTEDRLSPEDKLGSFFRDRIVIVDSVSKIDSFFVHRDSLPVLQQDSSPFVLVAQRNTSRGKSSIDTLAWGEDSLLLIRQWSMGRYKRRSQIFELQLSELLTHQSGVPAGLPILPFMNYRDSLTGKYDRYYHPSEDSIYSIPVAGNFFMRHDYWDSLWNDTKAINVSPAKAYDYSDANMILVQQAIDSINQEPIDQYLRRELYEGLGMQNTSFRPRTWCEPERIVPTTYDGAWRGQLLRGYVHDPTAALLGGVSGNAGLFSNTQDLAHLFQMILNQGHYGGVRYLTPSIVRQYTGRQGGHRGYGFDKPPTYRSEYIVGSLASTASYGHTGFTGTCVWVDPEEELIYIFLSNRVHPKASNWKLNELQIRQRIHDVVYEAIAEADKHND